MTRNFLALRRRPEHRGRRLTLEPLESRQLLAGDTVNHPPVGVNDALATMQGTPLAIASADLLANDSDPDGDSLRVTIMAGGGPSHGTLSLTSAGNFYYLPQHDFVGSDSFLYFAWDGQAFSAQTTVTIVVTPIIHLPEARNDYYTTPVNTKLDVAAPGVLANDGPFYPPQMQPTNGLNQSMNPLPTPGADGCARRGASARHGDVEWRRQLYLYAEHGFQRPGYVHVSRHLYACARRRQHDYADADFDEHRQGHDQRDAHQSGARSPQRLLHDAGKRRPHGGGSRSVGQRQLAFEFAAHSRGDHRSESRDANAESRRQFCV